MSMQFSYKKNNVFESQAVAAEIETQSTSIDFEKPEPVEIESVKYGDSAAAAGDPLSNIPHLTRSEYRALINETLTACAANWHPVCGDPDPDGIHQTAIGEAMHQIRHDPSIIDAEARRLCRAECDKFKKMYLESSETYLRAARAQIGGLSDSLKTRMIEIREGHIQRGESDMVARILTVQHAVEMKWISAEPGSPIGGGNGDGE